MIGALPRRFSTFVIVNSLAAVLCFGSTCWAQDGEVAAPDGEVAAPAAEPEAAPAEVPAAAPAGGGEPEIVQESFLTWMIRASGAFGLVLLILSFIMVALIMMNILQVRRSNLLPGDFIDDFEDKLTGKDYQGAYELARTDDSFIARVLAAGLAKLNRGYSEAVEGMQEVGEDESMAMEHKLSYLALIGSIAPMIGLMGTVWGMINSFQTIARSTTQPKPAELADGISTALFTTLEGLMVAIPAMVAYSLLRNRVARYVLEVGIISEGLMQRFAAMGKSKPGGGGATVSPAAPRDE
ncbi:Biopolymer transport protein ExbB [Calycomorphotria hydatis]|uniref:Biopolymer transport protein ExbB n=2 Tax=Calycomorphotria hydatis TaxID=2528027 RepID=A0A517TBV1_9PLAN|nr:Biopolymer transport protein ExbB [Calycomorphotria hydatis]